MEYGERFGDAVATELRAQRARVRISYESLVEATGLARSTLANYLEGRRQIPLEAFIDICAALHVEPRDIFAAAQQVIEQD